MLGTICGDIIGSKFEHHNIHHKEFELFTRNNRFTDDTVMTCAISKACLQYKHDKDINQFKQNCIINMQKLGRKYYNAGYGGRFRKWLLETNPQPYNSFGNGSAMRVSPIAEVAESLEETQKLAKISAEVTHNHEEGIKGAVCLASAIWLLNHDCTKEEIRDYVNNNFYKLNFKIDEIKNDYKFDVSCQGSVPHAIEAFLESKNFEDSIRIAISLGGDSDTIAAMTGSLSEAYYGIPMDIASKAVNYLDVSLLKDVTEFYQNTKTIEESKIK